MKHKDKNYLYVSQTIYISSDYFPKFLDTNKIKNFYLDNRENGYEKYSRKA